MPLTLTQRVLAHGGIYTFARFLHRAKAVLLLPVYAHFIGPEGFGVISIFATLGAFLSILFGQGLQASWFRLRFDQTGRDELRVFETTLFWYLAGSVLVGVCLLSTIGESLTRWATDGMSYFPLGFLTALTASGMVLSNLYERRVQADKLYFRFALFSGALAAFNLVVVVFFVAYLRRGAAGKIEAEALSALFFAAIAALLIRPGSPSLCSWSTLRSALSYGMPMIPHALAMTTNELIDRLFLNRILGTAATGVYAMGYQVAALASVFAVALNQAYSPLFIQTLKSIEGDSRKGKGESAATDLGRLARSSLLVPALVGVVALLLTAVAREGLFILTTEAFSDSWKVVAPVSAGLFAFAWYAAFNQVVFYYLDRVRWAPVASITAALINVAGNILLIPLYGIMGAAFATLLSYSVLAGFTFLIGKGALRVPYDWSRGLAMSLILGAGLTALWFLDLMTEPGLALLILKIGAALVAGGISLWAGGFAPRHLRRLAVDLGERLRM